MDKVTATIWRNLLRIRQSNQPLPKPNLFGVGAARCGSTTLFHTLSQTDNIYMSPVKELVYFSHKQHVWTEREYLMFFQGSENYRWRGEISPHYLHHEHVPLMIKNMAPDAQIIIQLRDPVRRTISHFKHHAHFHKIKDINQYFENAIAAYKADQYPGFWAHPVHNLRQSFYYEGVQRYLDEFSISPPHVVFLDDLNNDPDNALSSLENALEVTFPSLKDKRHNKSTPISGSGSLNPDLRDELQTIFEANWEKTCSLFGRKPSEFSI